MIYNKKCQAPTQKPYREFLTLNCALSLKISALDKNGYCADWLAPRDSGLWKLTKTSISLHLLLSAGFSSTTTACIYSLVFLASLRPKHKHFHPILLATLVFPAPTPLLLLGAVLEDQLKENLGRKSLSQL